MAELRLDDENMKALIAKAIMDTLTVERREELLKASIVKLLETKRGNTYDGRSELQIAFDYAVVSVAQQVAFKELAEDGGLKEKVRALMVDAWDRMAGGESREKLVQKVAEGMERALKGRDY